MANEFPRWEFTIDDDYVPIFLSQERIAVLRALVNTGDEKLRNFQISKKMLELNDLYVKILGNEKQCRTIDDFLYESDLSKYLVSNSKTFVHIISKIINDDDAFSRFDHYYNLYFETKSAETSVITLSIFERIFLRILRFKSIESSEEFFKNITQHHISETFRIDYSFRIMGLSLSPSKDGNDNDVPSTTNQVVSCSNKEFSLFSAQVCEVVHNDDMEPFAKQIMLRYLVGKTEQMFRLTRENPLFIRGRRNIVYAYLSHVKNVLSELFDQSRSQRIQIHEIVGKSGIGKSQSIDSFAHLIHSILPTISYSDLVYSRANDYWWNGYCGQPIVLYDDFTHIKKKMKFDLIFELIAVASGKFRNPPMAFEKNMEFTSTFVFVTSNIPLQTITEDQLTKVALMRRVESNQWENTKGLYTNGNKNFKGIMLNFIQQNSRNVFSLVCESFEIFKETSFFDFEMIHNPIDTTKPELTSSVSESYSAVNGLEGVPCGTSISAEENLNDFSSRSDKYCEMRSSDSNIKSLQNNYYNAASLMFAPQMSS